MKQKYWLAENGEVRCLDSNCPQECDMECPIHLKTLAIPYSENGHFDEAAKYLEKAVKIEPTFAEAWNNLAACYGQMGRHQDAFEAYLKSYQLRPKDNPLYGMAVAMKNLGNYSMATQYTSLYVHKFGADDRINSIIAEVAERKLAAEISRTAEKQAQAQKPVQGPQNDMQLYGALYLLLLDKATRDEGYAEMEKMEDRFPEAAVTLGQYYQGDGDDDEKAKAHFKIAADAGIAEAQWNYSQLLPHPYVLDLSDEKDKEYLKYCLAAAEGGCPDAANEMGNICHRKGFYEESTYWYGMAFSLEHPEGMLGLKGITKEWSQKGIAKEFTPHIEGFTEDMHTTSLILYRLLNQSFRPGDMDELIKLALRGENLAGFIAGFLLEQNKQDDMAYRVYNALAYENHPHSFRCYADMILAGKGTARNVETAFRYYEKAALAGNATAMFAMGQKAAKENDLLTAAAWFGMAYDRGMEMAKNWLIKLAGK